MNKKIIITGIVGILASTLMYTGDMLLYFTPHAVKDFQTEIIQIMATMPSERLIAGGLLGPASAFLYTIGFYHIYLLIKANNKKIAKLILVLLCFGIFYGGAFHTHFPILGFIAKYNSNPIQPVEKFAILNLFFTFLPSLIAYALLGYLIIAKKTPYPRWLVLFSPIVLYWLSAVIKKLPQPLMMLTAGGWSNLIFIIFFTISTVLSYQQGYETS